MVVLLVLMLTAELQRRIAAVERSDDLSIKTAVSIRQCASGHTTHDNNNLICYLIFRGWSVVRFISVQNTRH